MKYWIILSLGLSLTFTSCSGEKEETKENKDAIDIPDNLVKVEGDLFTEYYPGGKQIKFQGHQDENKQRHGKWVHYSQNGIELSTLTYMNGKKHGVTVVKYPNGALYYIGEYDNDKKCGVWKVYDQKGKIISEEDLGYPEK